MKRGAQAGEVELEQAAGEVDRLAATVRDGDRLGRRGVDVDARPCPTARSSRRPGRDRSSRRAGCPAGRTGSAPSPIALAVARSRTRSPAGTSGSCSGSRGCRRRSRRRGAAEPPGRDHGGGREAGAGTWSRPVRSHESRSHQPASGTSRRAGVADVDPLAVEVLRVVPSASQLTSTAAGRPVGARRRTPPGRRGRDGRPRPARPARGTRGCGRHSSPLGSQSASPASISSRERSRQRAARRGPRPSDAGACCCGCPGRCADEAHDAARLRGCSAR